MAAQTYTLTFGDQAENHVGMQKLGTLAEEGFTFEDLQRAEAWFREHGAEPVLYHLNKQLPPELQQHAENAYLLYVPAGVNCIGSADVLLQEQVQLQYDTQAFMYGRVVNKHARYNLCFAPEGQEPDYENGKGRVVSFDDVPYLKQLRNAFPEIIGTKAAGLFTEGNHYYDVTKSGIGFHGDMERRKVIAVRLGASMPLHYQWFYQSKPIGIRGALTLNHGDLYVMSEKAVGTDWKKRSQLTLRHAAGAEKYLQTKK